MTETARRVHRSEVCSLSAVRKVAAMLDFDWTSIADRELLPRGWHFFLMAGDTPRAALRADGFPGLGVAMPDLGLPRLLLGGRTVTFRRDIPIGATVHRASGMKSLVSKTSDTGPMAIATVEHELRIATEDEPFITEQQTYLLLEARRGDAEPSAARPIAHPGPDERRSTVTPDDTLLFQYSALGFNSHKIHLDRLHAREVEGYPDLVVNGGLTTLLMTEYLRRELGVVPTTIKVRHSAPLFCNRPMTLTARAEAARWRVTALDENHARAVEMEVETR